MTLLVARSPGNPRITPARSCQVLPPMLRRLGRQLLLSDVARSNAARSPVQQAVSNNTSAASSSDAVLQLLEMLQRGLEFEAQHNYCNSKGGGHPFSDFATLALQKIQGSIPVPPALGNSINSNSSAADADADADAIHAVVHQELQNASVSMSQYNQLDLERRRQLLDQLGRSVLLQVRKILERQAASPRPLSAPKMTIADTSSSSGTSDVQPHTSGNSTGSSTSYSGIDDLAVSTSSGGGSSSSSVSPIGGDVVPQQQTDSSAGSFAHLQQQEQEAPHQAQELQQARANELQLQGQTTAQQQQLVRKGSLGGRSPPRPRRGTASLPARPFLQQQPSPQQPLQQQQAMQPAPTVPQGQHQQQQELQSQQLRQQQPSVREQVAASQLPPPQAQVTQQQPPPQLQVTQQQQQPPVRRGPPRSRGPRGAVLFGVPFKQQPTAHSPPSSHQQQQQQPLPPYQPQPPPPMANAQPAPVWPAVQSQSRQLQQQQNAVSSSTTASPTSPNLAQGLQGKFSSSSSSSSSSSHASANAVPVRRSPHGPLPPRSHMSYPTMTQPHYEVGVVPAWQLYFPLPPELGGPPIQPPPAAAAAAGTTGAAAVDAAAAVSGERSGSSDLQQDMRDMQSLASGPEQLSTTADAATSMAVAGLPAAEADAISSNGRSSRSSRGQETWHAFVAAAERALEQQDKAEKQAQKNTAGELKQRTDAWLALRERRLTGSALANMLSWFGRNSNDHVRLWKEKLKLQRPPPANEKMRYGTHWEHHALSSYKQLAPQEHLSDMGFAVWGPDGAHAWLGASPDGLITSLGVSGLNQRAEASAGGDAVHVAGAGAAGATTAAAAAGGGGGGVGPTVMEWVKQQTGSSLEGVLEIKCPYKASPNVEAPRLPHRADEYYMPQVQVLCEVLDCEWAVVYYWSEHQGSHMTLIHRDREYFALLWQAMADFWWRHVIPAKLVLDADNSSDSVALVEQVYSPELHAYRDEIIKRSRAMVDTAPQRTFTAAETRPDLYSPAATAAAAAGQATADGAAAVPADVDSSAQDSAQRLETEMEVGAVAISTDDEL